MTWTFCSPSPCCSQSLWSAASTFLRCPAWTHYRTLRHSVEASTHSVFIDYALGLGFYFHRSCTTRAHKHTHTHLQTRGDEAHPSLLYYGCESNSVLILCLELTFCMLLCTKKKKSYTFLTWGLLVLKSYELLSKRKEVHKSI